MAMVWTKKTTCVIVYLIICLSLGFLLTACPRKTPQKPPPEVVDMGAIQDYYNQGLQFYADEQYGEAKKAWQQVIKLGPNTRLAVKARAYVKKVNRMLKTLQEIENKR
jgi:outer membrane protein assembly factor BamD (BamD/ComL family)